MKNIRSKLLQLLALAAILFLLCLAERIFFDGSADPKQTGHAKKSGKTVVERDRERENITFILGEDEEPGKGFFSQATNYYRHHPVDGTERVILTCRSLLEVRNYLTENPPANDRPWGLVNLVVHGNEWSGLGVPVLPGGRRTTVALLQEAARAGQFSPVPAHLADGETEFYIHGCAVGRNSELLKALHEALAGRRKLAVRASPYFIKYISGDMPGKKDSHRRQQLEGYYAFYPKDNRPPAVRLIDQLKSQYPEADLDWEEALDREVPLSPDEIYHHTFDIPVVWVVAYPDESMLPDLEKWRAQEAWLAEQRELKALLREYGIPRDHFQWTFLKVTHTMEDGRKVPAIRAIGLCTVLTVLRPVTPLPPSRGDLSRSLIIHCCNSRAGILSKD